MKAVIFDLDGTILDTLEDLGDSLNQTLSEFGYPCRRKEEVRSFVGSGIGKLIERALDGYGATPQEVQQILARFTAIYAEHLADKTKPYDTIPALLKQLRNAGFATAVFSNKVDFAVQELGRRYFPGLFDLYRGELPDVPRKPSPAGLLRILRELSVEKEDAVYVGDSEVDIQTAGNAGIPVIGVSWGFRSEEALRGAGATRIARNTEELAKELGL